MQELRFRQVHLDFHTSEAIEGIGAAFSPEAFAATLERAHVNSINIFARGHHGWIYYDSERFPEQRHPHLTSDLLGQQLQACHRHGITAPIYVSVQIDNHLADRHPEWRVREADGRLQGAGPYDAGFGKLLCLNSPYVSDWLEPFVQEILERFEVDGMWFDIVDARDCSCAYCKAGMLAGGIDPCDKRQRMGYAQAVLERFMARMTTLVHARVPDALIFYNAGHVGPRHRGMLPNFTHLELESLPSGWGYPHYAITQRYARTLGIVNVGMTGKFHTLWGDFSSYKNPAALQYECFRMLALASKCCVGDQLLPSGALDPTTYELLEPVYASVEAKEPWCHGVEPRVEIGVITPEAFDETVNRREMDLGSIMGCNRMLEEGGYQFDIIDGEGDLSAYRLLILPDKVPVGGALRDKLDAYLAAGGALIASFASGMNREQSAFALDALGVRLTGEGPRDAEGHLARGRIYRNYDFAEYVRPRSELGADLPCVEHVAYLRGMQIAADDDTVVLADIVPTHFDRSYQHWCSHRQAPSCGVASQPAITQRDRVIYFSSPVFKQYSYQAPRWCRELVLAAVRRILPDPLVELRNAPTGLLATLNRQPAEARDILHLLYYVPERRGEAFDVIEDIVPLHDVGVSVRCDRVVSSVRTVPEGEALDFEQTDGCVSFTLPRLVGHQMIECK